MLEKGISAIVATDGAMAVLVAIVSLGTKKNEFGEERLTLMSTAALIDGSIVVTMTSNSGKMIETKS